MTDVIKKIKAIPATCSFSKLKKNWYLPIAAVAFCCLNFTGTKVSAVAAIISLISSCVLAAYSESIVKYVWFNRNVTIVSIVSAIGISLGELDAFTTKCLSSEKLLHLLDKNDLFPVLFDVGRYACAFLAAVFIFIFVMLFWKKVIDIVQRNQEILSLAKSEKIVYLILLLLSCIYVTYSFVNSGAFYDSTKQGVSYNAIYSADSTMLFRPSSYLIPTHHQNDLRQPLFALFAAPFVGIPYLMGIPFSVTVQAILINIVQIVMLLFANLMITKAMKVKPAYRICFMLLSFCMYSNLLFSVMMEQYIVAFFWLSTVVYAICTNDKHTDFQMVAAGGTLLTSFAFLPFINKVNPLKDFKKWLLYMSKIILCFIGLMALFCKFDVLINVFSELKQLLSYSGKDVAFSNQLYQFTEFVKGCFISPKAGADFSRYNHAAWVLYPVTSYSIIGIIILLLSIFSIIIHHKKVHCIISGGWVVFSIILLGIVGWGARENTFILYALYFGWAYLVLIFQLIITACEKIKLKFGVPIVSVIICCVMLALNIPAIFDILKFSFRYFPC